MRKPKAAGGARVLGIDIGSSACKAGSWTLSGGLVAEARVPYRNGSAGAWWEAARAAARAVSSGGVIAVGLSGQIGTQVLVDRALAPLGMPIGWDDGRSARAQAEIHERFGATRLDASLGLHLPPGPAWPLGRLRWLARERPEDIAVARALVQPKDYVLLQLCGELVSDASSWRGAVRPDGELASDLFDELGLPEHLVPPTRSPAAVAARILPAVAEELGLAPGVRVVIGTNDLNSGLLGSGVADVGQCFDVGGTSEHAGMVLPGPVDDPRLVSVPRGGALPLDGHLVYGVSSNGGRVATWADRQLGGDPESLPPFASISRALRRSAPGARGVLFLPYLAGERSPIWDDSATGAWLRLRDAHTRDDLVRAALEGVVFNLRHILDCVFEHAPARGDAIRVAGGVARSAAWNRVKADILQMDVVSVDAVDASALGAAMLASVGVEAHPTVVEAARVMARPSPTISPDRALAGTYNESYAAFREFSAALNHGGGV